MKKYQADQEFREVELERQRQIAWCNRLWNLAVQRQQQRGGAVMQVDQDISMRSLYISEVKALQDMNSQCQDWSQIRLVVSTEQHRLDQSALLRRFVSHSTFQGTVVLMLPQSVTETSTIHTEDVSDSGCSYKNLPAGIHSNACISNSILHLQARVRCNIFVRDTFCDRNAVLVNCGSVTCPDSIQYNELSLTVGPESGGGRDLVVAADSTMMNVCDQLTGKTTATKATLSKARSFNIVSEHALIRDTPTVQGAFLHPHAAIHAATSVSAATLYPNATISNACTVNNVILQWNAAILDHSVVSGTMLMEQAAAGPQSLVASSILGPDVHVSAGEIHASVIGPNTNAHHQSLLIGVLWPTGRGNVGYGANVGSNHTGRLPDQETCAGEGTFWGLSCVVKMPVNLMQAPYSVVAAGTTVPPQCVRMPFSLLVDGSIIPAWVLQSSPYTLARSATKFANRRKAVRHLHYTGWKILRPETIDQCIWARAALQDAHVQETYSGDRDVRGIGSCTLTEKGRQSGIRAYTDCIERFALQGLLVFLKRGRGIDEASLASEVSRAKGEQMSYVSDSVSWGTMPWRVDESGLWSYQRSLIVNEYGRPSAGVLAWAKVLLGKLVSLEKDYADRVYRSKKRDDDRGQKTIPGYEDAHVAAENDPVIKSARAAYQETKETVEALLREMDQIPISKL